MKKYIAVICLVCPWIHTPGVRPAAGKRDFNKHAPKSHPWAKPSVPADPRTGNCRCVQKKMVKEKQDMGDIPCQPFFMLNYILD